MPRLSPDHAGGTTACPQHEAQHLSEPLRSRPRPPRRTPRLVQNLSKPLLAPQAWGNTASHVRSTQGGIFNDSDKGKRLLRSQGAGN